jgi:magnesium-transporting ATPase (P-type)
VQVVFVCMRAVVTSRAPFKRPAMPHSPSQVVRDGALVCIPWRHVITGDIVVVLDKEEFPADVVLLATSEELGKCFTEVCCQSLKGTVTAVDHRVPPAW